MILVRPSLQIITDIDSDRIMRNIEAAGRTCYKSEEKIADGSAEKFAAMILSRGHESVIEHESMSVRFVCDRGVSHELVRHRLAAYSQESTRYCNYKGGVVFVIPPWIEIEEGAYGFDYPASPDDATNEWLNAMCNLERAYHSLLEGGWSPQQARSVLPNSLKTEIVMTANLREWRHVLRLRCSKAAHPQMRELMVALLVALQKKLPVLFGDIKVSGL